MSTVQITMHVILILLSCVVHVHSKFQCIGTCYSGQLFPNPEDIDHGKHLKGYSYRNITTDDAKKCYSSCINDCRCKACQMKDARCELMDEDHTSKPSDFISEPEYVYYDLKQEFYKGKSHMVQPGVCYNGCCRSQPCMNGGTCVEHCHNPKEKFSCSCTKSFTGKVCEEKVITRCHDMFTHPGTIPRNGNYTITRSDNGVKVCVYCAFTSNQSWTLIESFSLENKDHFKGKSFFKNNNRNTNHPNWKDYRMSLKRIQNYFRTTATLFRATCDFPKRVGSLTPDYLLGKLSDVDITSITSTTVAYGQCKKYLHINIVGHECFDCTAATYCTDRQHIYLDVSWLSRCDFKPSIQHNADNFGIYGDYDSRSICVLTPQSTTQWWLGEEK